MQVESERRIQNLVNHLRWNDFGKQQLNLFPFNYSRKPPSFMFEKILDTPLQEVNFCKNCIKIKKFI